MSERKARVVVAGQLPPPLGGQNVMVERALQSLSSVEELDVIHLPFRFTPDWRDHRRIGLRKVWELVVVVARLARIRFDGPVDCLLYPFGGPHPAPILRDVALLPFCLIAARRVFLHIHAGGIAEALPRLPRSLGRVALEVYRRCAAAIVLTEFSRADAAVLGVRRIHVVSNSLPDSFDQALVDRSPKAPSRLLAVGHLGGPKGTPELLQAVAGLRLAGHDVRLTLIGEPLPPYSMRTLQEHIYSLDVDDIVTVAGVVVGAEKCRAFGEADLFVFPSTAPESQPLVLLEAMMWGLPIVASDWRSHREILGDPPGGICYRPGDEASASLGEALDAALRAGAQLEAWGLHNRRRFEQRFDESRSPLRDFIRHECSRFN